MVEHVAGGAHAGEETRQREECERQGRHGLGSARELLSRATPRPWRWKQETWTIVGPRDEQAVMGGPGETLTFIAPNIELAITAVNEYEALLDLERLIRIAATPLALDPANGPVFVCVSRYAAKAMLARLDEVRGG